MVNEPNKNKEVFQVQFTTNELPKLIMSKRIVETNGINPWRKR